MSDRPYKTNVPRAEDMPLILGWIKPHQGHVCEKCKQPAGFQIDEYEDRSVIEKELNEQVVFIDALEDKLWQHTVKEQMAGDYIVHQTYFRCLDCLLPLLQTFLNTPHTGQLREVLTKAPAKGYSFVQYHWLSYPEFGLLAVTKAKSIPELLSQFKDDVPGYKIRR